MITLQKWVERGQVDCVKKGRTYLFDRRDFADQITAKDNASVQRTLEERTLESWPRPIDIWKDL